MERLEEVENKRQVPASLSRSGSLSVVGNEVELKSRNEALIEAARLEEVAIQKEYEARLALARRKVVLAEAGCHVEGDSDKQASGTAKSTMPSGLDEYFKDCDGLREPELFAGKVADEPTRSSVSGSPHLVIGSTHDLPRVDLQTFDGSRGQYWKFIRQFEEYVECRVTDPGQRFLFLQHYCRGMAREAISDCVLIPRSEAYRKARDILEDLFGQRHQLARSMLSDLIPSARIGDAEDLLKLSIKMLGCETALTQMCLTADLNATPTLESISRKLPIRLQHDWAKVAFSAESSGYVPGFKELREFIAENAKVARSRFGQLALDSKNIGTSSSSARYRPSNTRTIMQVEAIQDTSDDCPRVPRACPLCEELHALITCPRFLSDDVGSRWDTVRRMGRCFGCLQENHLVSKCNAKRQCLVNGCRGWHHKLLHRGGEGERKPGQDVVCNSVKTELVSVKLGIIPVRIRTGSATTTVYALLDNGSDASLITPELSEKLEESSKLSSLTIRTVAGTIERVCRINALDVGPLDGTEWIRIDRAYAMPDFRMYVSDSEHDTLRQWSHLTDISLPVLTDRRVHLIIGADVPEAHWVWDQRLGTKKQPYAARTSLGWAIRGPLGEADRGTISTLCTNVKHDELLQNMLQYFESDFLVDDFPEKKRSMEDEEASRIVRVGCKIIDGHFTIPLPWKYEAGLLPNNRIVAERRLAQLKRRCARDSTLYEKYRNAIDEMFAKGYASAVPPEMLDPGYPVRWYLPHHAVFHPRKPDKLRVVMDCASAFQGVSLNSALYSGPDSVAELATVLLRFRRERYAVSADVKEMFMQVRVPEVDRAALRFLWWPAGDCGQEPLEFLMTVHPFGATSSPFCATYALRQVIEEFGSHYSPSVRDKVLTCFYVDDCLTSFRTKEEARLFVRDVTELLSKGGFRLHKWISNEMELLNLLSPAQRQTERAEVTVCRSPTNSVLGVGWNTATDCFVYLLTLPPEPCTRRKALSALSSYYDPLGLIAPALLPGKIILQQLCKAGLGWDESIPDELQSAWTRWTKTLATLNELEVPRCLRKQQSDVATEFSLHVFCDASENGYGAVAYLCLGSEWSLVCSKCRVAPIKSVSIPRLELAAAVLGVKVELVVSRALGLERKETTYWTDSTIVLHYIKNTSKRYATYVANRVSFLSSHSTSGQWKHIDSASNPADLTSRGIVSSNQWHKWLRGPEGLSLSDISQDYLEPQEQELELKKTVRVSHCAMESDPTGRLLRRFSSWSKLVISVCWLIRFKSFITSRMKSGQCQAPARPPSVSEMRSAERAIIKATQRESFGIRDVQEGKVEKELSELRSLCPVYIDGVVCVGGRLHYGSYSNDFKHPIVLPKKHHVVDILVRHVHELHGHCGSAQVLAIIRKRYWIVHGLQTVKRVIRRCVTCSKLNAPLCRQPMAPLPEVRVQGGWFPFSNVGLDYFGPFYVKRGRGTVKRYGCLFTCLQIRAIHLELSADLSTDSFIMVFLRFVGRRGLPTHVYSDNGTNFVGALADLRGLISKWDVKRIGRVMAEREVQWHFNPPEGSHRGGVWERMIRSVRRILISTASDQNLTEEVLHTLLVQAESIVNGRPLVPVSANIEDRPPLRLTTCCW